MVALFSHVHHIVTVDADAGGFVQFSIVFTILPKLSQELSLCCEHLNAVVVEVSHIHIPSAVKCHIIGVVELSIITAMTAKGTGECQVGVQNLNAMIPAVCYIYFLVVWVDGNTSSIVEFKKLATTLTYYCNRLPIWCELLNGVIVCIHHQGFATTIHCHTPSTTKVSMS